MKVKNPLIELVTPYEYLVKTAHNCAASLTDPNSNLVLTSLSCDEIAAEFDRFKDVYISENAKLINSIINDLLYERKLEGYSITNNAGVDLDISLGYSFDKEEWLKENDTIDFEKIKSIKPKIFLAWIFQLFVYVFFDNKLVINFNGKPIEKLYQTTNRLIMLYTFLLEHSDKSNSHTKNMSTIAFNSYRKITMNALSSIYINPNMTLCGTTKYLPAVLPGSSIPAMNEKFEAVDTEISLDSYLIKFTAKEIVDRCVELIDLDIQKLLIFDKKTARQELHRYYDICRSILFNHKDTMNNMIDAFKATKVSGAKEDVAYGVEKMIQSLDKNIARFKSLTFLELSESLKKSPELKEMFELVISEKLSFTKEEISRINNIYDNSDVLKKFEEFNKAMAPYLKK